MKRKLATVLCCLAWGASSLFAPAVEAAVASTPTADVALRTGGTLVGKLVDPQGRPLTKAFVSVVVGGKEIASTVTDSTGGFQLAGLQGGVIEVEAHNTSVLCRAWAPQTAPPQAQSGLLVVAGGDVVCGQNCSHGVGCGAGVGRGSGYVRGHGGGILGIMADRPLVAAGIVGAAIAIPIAVSNSSDPATP